MKASSTVVKCLYQTYPSINFYLINRTYFIVAPYELIILMQVTVLGVDDSEAEAFLRQLQVLFYLENI